jgi:hypothetical protein
LPPDSGTFLYTVLDSSILADIKSVAESVPPLVERRCRSSSKSSKNLS